MKNKNFILIISILVMLLGVFLPTIRIEQESISFVKGNGILVLILIFVMFILVILKKKEYVYIPSTISLAIIIKFILENAKYLQQINELYNRYVEYEYGLLVLVIGNLMVIISLTLSFINLERLNKKYESKEQIEKKLNQEFLKKQKEKKEKITHETTKDGKIKFNKIIVKVDNKETEKKSKQISSNSSLWSRLFSSNKKNHLSISKFNDEKESVSSNKKMFIRTMPVINIQKWTRSKICCLNCGATVNTNSNYCFLCDCKIILKDNEKKVL